ncbi:hypothetical protein [Sphingobium nicotianae]|uniref:Peptidylglycine monooxygenase n=1 Tax=Sphingobium nicotianae TaxID=2782607 RepID=A0A9X1IQD5_9SPHN|nr:hypothetical protein [Sphingobium nicotianae]MBT2186541.1 hypothetical protein [Sphingobium nicotianae]
MNRGRAKGAWSALALLLQLTTPATIAATSPRDAAYRVDITWPQPLPDKWLLGDVGGVSVDRHNHIWIVNRPGSSRPVDLQADNNPPTAKCCVAAPPVIEFDQTGKVVRSWGGPQQIDDWFDSEHAIFVDDEDHVWILGAGAHDGLLMKFISEGRLLLHIGRKGNYVAADDPTMLGAPTDVYVDTKRQEVFVSDGYRNHRVIVFDSETGVFKRQWTAYGKTVDPAYATERTDPAYSQQGHHPDHFTTVHCVTMIGGELYVCDRANDRIQVFTPEGKYVRNISYNRGMAGSIGSTWDAAPLPGRADVIVALDGTNSEIAVLDTRSGAVRASYLSKGRYAGQMQWPHQLAIDREGRAYVAEVGTGARVQRFVPNSKAIR